MRLIVFFLLIVGAAQCAAEELHFEAKDIEKIVHDTDTDVVAIYSFVNGSDTSVRILDVKTDCACSTATVSNNICAPGQTGSVIVRFKPTETARDQFRFINVVTDHGAPYELSLKVKLDSGFLMAPSRVVWLLNDNRGRTVTIRLISVDARSVHVDGTKCGVDAVIREIEKDRVMMIELRPRNGDLPHTGPLLISAVGRNGQKFTRTVEVIRGASK